MQRSKLVVLLGTALAAAGCASHYTTPAGGVPMVEVADEDLQSLYEREPVSPFPRISPSSGCRTQVTPRKRATGTAKAGTRS